MASFRPDLRKVFRALGARAQDNNLERLLTAQDVSGGEVAQARPHDVPAPSGRRKRIRLLGVRVALADLRRLGVKSGELARDLVRRGNVKVTRTGFKIIPGEGVIMRWRAFVAGTKRQEARPVGGLSGELLDDAADEIALETRNQFVRALNDRGVSLDG